MQVGSFGDLGHDLRRHQIPVSTLRVCPRLREEPLAPPDPEPGAEVFEAGNNRLGIRITVRRTAFEQPHHESVHLVRDRGSVVLRVPDRGLYRIDHQLHDRRPEPIDGIFTWVDSMREHHTAAYLSDRWRSREDLTLELGLRLDAYSATDEREVSPRLSLAWAVGESSVLRAALGRFVQSHRPNELQLADWQTQLQALEISDQVSLAFEHYLLGASRLAGTTLRAELYHREIDDPRVRYENLYEPFNEFPELEPDRVRIAPEESLAQGFELSLQAPGDRRWMFWGNYAWSRSEDTIDGREVPRSIDQPHALNLNLKWEITSAWTASFAWRYHTGWPTTPLGLEEVEVEADEDEILEPGEPSSEEETETIFVPVLGPLNSERLSAYHRLDLRISRTYRLENEGRLVLFLDVQNLYNRKNLAGFQMDIDQDEGTLSIEKEYWPGIFPSIGIKREF